MFAKLTGILVFIFVIGKAAGVGGEQMKYFTDIAKITLTQHEVNSIAHLIYSGEIVGGERLPEKSDEEWAKYIRAQMRSKLSGRDSSKDFWMTPYRVEEVDVVPGLTRSGFVVRSAGPDATGYNDDDITSGYEYR